MPKERYPSNLFEDKTKKVKPFICAWHIRKSKYKVGKKIGLWLDKDESCYLPLLAKWPMREVSTISTQFDRSGAVLFDSISVDGFQHLLIAVLIRKEKMFFLTKYHWMSLRTLKIILKYKENYIQLEGYYAIKNDFFLHFLFNSFIFVRFLFNNWVKCNHSLNGLNYHKSISNNFIVKLVHSWTKDYHCYFIFQN